MIMELNLSAMRRAGANRAAFANLLQELGFCDGYIIEQKIKHFSMLQGLPKSQATYNLLLQKV